MKGGGGTMFLDPAELVVTSVWPLAASEARFGDVPDETLFTFSFCCQCLHAVFALFTLKHDHNKALGARGEAAFTVSQGDTLLSTATTGFKSNTVKSSCNSAAEWADNGYI